MRHAAAVLLCFAVASSSAPALAADPADDAVHELHALFDSEWERQLAEDPVEASILGDRRYDDRWPEVSVAAAERRHQARVAALARLAAIDRSALPAAEQLNHDLFRRQYEQAVASHRFREFLMPLDHRDGVQTADELHDFLPFATVADYEAWIARLRGVGTLVDGTLELLRQGLAEQRTPPRVLLERALPLVTAQIVDDPAASPFYDPFETFPGTVPEAAREALRQEARTAISRVVVPAYRRLETFVRQEYVPGARQAIAARALPDGEAYYAQLVRRYTTTELTPRQIHELGLSEVARIRAQMQAIIAQVGFTGSFDEFLRFLRSDPQFYYRDGEALLAAYREICKRIDPELPRLFGKLPRMPYGVRPIPAETAPNTTTAYYNVPAGDGSRPGWYSVNLYQPLTRPKYEMEVLSVHEAVPGHHLQLALQQELGELPAFRRYGGYTAFIEGWGLYSESLGDELGLYRDPYSKFGQLTYEMWRAVRLVVDTGIHQLGWERQQAIDYFAANAAKTELDIVNEVDRYIGTPGQALAYKIGELKLQELRRRAHERLGERFDVREFHDAVLGSGALPLDVLERQIDAWIERTGSAENP